MDRFAKNVKKTTVDGAARIPSLPYDRLGSSAAGFKGLSFERLCLDLMTGLGLKLPFCAFSPNFMLSFTGMCILAIFFRPCMPVTLLESPRKPCTASKPLAIPIPSNLKKNEPPGVKAFSYFHAKKKTAPLHALLRTRGIRKEYLVK